MPKGNPKNITYARFGRLVALYPTNERKDGVVWMCRCDCGNQHKVSMKNLTNGDTKSCGCLYNETRKSRLLPDGIADFNNLYATYRNGAERRNINFNLDIEQFKNLTSKNCHYCNKAPLQRASRSKMTTYYPHNGIDRIDSSSGYEIDNVVPCCERCNRLKMKMGYEEFLNAIKEIYEFRISVNK